MADPLKQFSQLAQARSAAKFADEAAKAMAEHCDARIAEMTRQNSDLQACNNRLLERARAAEADRDNSNVLLDECRRERNLLQKICAQRADALAIATALPEATHRHIKRGTFYHVAGRGTLQSAGPISEGAELIYYISKEGIGWMRPVEEFEDGRFERLPDDDHLPIQTAKDDDHA